MSEKVELPKKKAAANEGRPETEDMPSVTTRKRKAGRTAGREPSAHEVGRRAEPTPKAQGRRSDHKPVCPVINPIFLSGVTVMPIQSTALERQRQRHPQALPAHRRMPVDMHRPRRSNMSNPGSRPLRTRRASVPPGPPRTMLQRMCLLKPRARSSPGEHIITDAWHTVLNSDPLVDSDEECPDEHLRLDYSGPLTRCIIVVYAHLSCRSANTGDSASTRTTPNSRTGVQSDSANLARISFPFGIGLGNFFVCI